MASGAAFFDSNVIIYAADRADSRRTRAAEVLRQGGVISVQVLNEFVNVARRKLGRPWAEIERGLQAVRGLGLTIVPVTLTVHERAVAIARTHSLQFYDACIIAAALEAGCTTLFSEDMQDGFQIDGLTIRNPF